MNQVDGLNLKIRSRFVKREIRLKGQEAIFAPPLELLRIVLSYGTTQFPNETQKIWVGESLDRPYFNAQVDEADPVYVELPPEIDAPTGGARSYATTCTVFGLGSDDDHKGLVLNRVVRWTSQGIKYEADPQQVEKPIRDTELQEANAVTTPGVKPPPH